MGRHTDNLASYLETKASEAGFILLRAQIQKFLTYLEELKAWNKKFNLTAIEDEKEILVKHFLDSLFCLRGLSSTDWGKIEKVVDIGSGAGFPGMPIKIYREDFSITLIEATGKKIQFLTHVSSRLGLDRGVEVLQGRAEDYGRKSKYREKFDLAVSRAVAKMATLCEYCLPLVKIGGLLICQKGKEINQEIEEARNAITKLGGRIREVVKYELASETGLYKRKLVVLEKIASTPEIYPRRPGIPAKRPIR